MLPHAYPFRLLDRSGDGTVVVLLSGNAAQLRGTPELPPLLAIEVLAQAALVALPGVDTSGGSAPAPRGGLLAGVEAVGFHAPLRSGDRLVASAVLLGRLGRLVKVRAELRRDQLLVVEGELLLAVQ